jgi:processive 1,2-diacylglycerol beta-glucosyltransferase
MRILIATVTAGGGHLAAAAALDETWCRLHPDDKVERVDILKYSKLEKKVIADGYVKMVANAPELLGLFFDKTDKPKVARRLSRLNRFFPSQSRSRFTRFLKEF